MYNKKEGGSAKEAFGFPSPGWGELIERRLCSQMDDIYQVLSFPSPGWGELIERPALEQESVKEETFPSPGWGELIERFTPGCLSRAFRPVSIPRLGRVDRKTSLQRPYRERVSEDKSTQ